MPIDWMAGGASLEERTEAIKFLKVIAAKAREICADARVADRIEKALAKPETLTPAERRLLGDFRSGV